MQIKKADRVISEPIMELSTVKHLLKCLPFSRQNCLPVAGTVFGKETGNSRFSDSRRLSHSGHTPGIFTSIRMRSSGSSGCPPVAGLQLRLRRAPPDVGIKGDAQPRLLYPGQRRAVIADEYPRLRVVEIAEAGDLPGQSARRHGHRRSRPERARRPRWPP